MKGFASSLDIMLQYRALLAPLRFGAGLKGKVWLPASAFRPDARLPCWPDAGQCRSNSPPLQVVDSWWHGLPVVTSGIGAEGMTAADAPPEDVAAAAAAAEGGHALPAAWGGLVSSGGAGELAAAAVQLYSDEQLWQACQRRGFELLRLLYSRQRTLDRVLRAVEGAAAEIEERRSADYVGAMLWQQQLRATEYFSRWIELKEGRAGAAAPPRQPGERGL